MMNDFFLIQLDIRTIVMTVNMSAAFDTVDHFIWTLMWPFPISQTRLSQ